MQPVDRIAATAAILVATCSYCFCRALFPKLPVRIQKDNIYVPSFQSRNFLLTFFLGHLPDVLAEKNAYQLGINWARVAKFRPTLVYILHKPMLTVVDPVDVHYMLQTNGSNYEKTESYRPLIRMIGNG